MSAFAVVLDLRGERLEPGVLDRVLEPIRDRGPDRTGRWIGGPVALGHHLLALTPEDVDSLHPVVLGQLVGVFDGRLDNRDELIRDLEVRPPAASTMSDGELAVRAFAQWRDESASHLLGDFALAVWDDERRSLYAARDQIGVRPLFYAERGGLLVVATDIRGVLAHPHLAKEPNERRVAETIAGTFQDDITTLYEGVLRLPAAHTLTATRQVTTQRYWDVEIPRHDRRADAGEILDQFLDLFGKAVRCRLRAGSVTVGLSGGLDSTLITAAAAREVVNGGAPGAVTTTSLVFPGFACDESEWIDAARSGLDLAERRITWTPVLWDGLLDEARRTQDLCSSPNAALDSLVRAGLRRTVVLTGSGGDQWMAGSLGYFHDLRVGRRYRDLLGYFSRGDGFWLVRDTVAGRLSRRWHGPTSTPVDAPLLDLVGARLRPWASAPRDMPLRELPANAPREDAARYHALHSSWLPAIFDGTDRAAGVGHLEGWHPFFDRRVVSFAFALTDSERWRGSDSRNFQRRALRRLGREKSAERVSKAEFTELYVAQMAALPLEELFRHSRIVGLDWVEHPAISDAIAAIRSGRESLAATIWTFVALEAWVRAVWGGSD